jgi:stage II sporulation protein D
LALDLRVAIEKGTSAVNIGSSTEALVKNGQGQVIGKIEAMGGFKAEPRAGRVALGNWQSSTLVVEPQNGGYIWIGNSWYRGRSNLSIRNGKVLAVNQVNIEDYLYSVVGAESIPSWPAEALKAQAVASRTYAINKLSKSNGYYDLDNTTATQVYKGLTSEYDTTIASVNATRGEVMTYGNQPILAVFHASSGGHTENVEDIWQSTSLPYLRGVADYDQNTPVYQWREIYTPQQLGAKIGGVGAVSSVTPVKTTPLGRVVTLKVVGDRGVQNISGDKFRSALGLKSTLISVDKIDGNKFQVYGKGFGHGVGLSQWGAYSLASQGYNYYDILSHYYQNTNLGTIN